MVATDSLHLVPAATPGKGSDQSGFRPEIQALRAVAILSVLIYHLWPNRLTGGYLGVDVFFVISGFLITSHLLRDAAGGRLSLPKFWARRIRRLLPASLVVLFVTAVVVLLAVPQRLWQQYLSEIVASTGYAENWFLAATSVDYLGSENDPSPVQHFWSLSTEEQFYIIWPVLIALTLVIWNVSHRVARGSKPPRRPLFLVLLIITIASFAYAVYASATDPSPAFFATTTRAWEFGAGSLLAFAATSWLHDRVSDHVRAVAAWIGWITIALCAVVFTDSTVHPGVMTLIPVAGALLVIWAGSSPSVLAPTFLARLRPVQFVGNISYSLYLWHWPFIVLIPVIFVHELTTVEKLAIILISGLLGYLSFRFIEKPMLRLPLAPRGTVRRWFIGALIGALVVSAVPAIGFAIQAQTAAAAVRQGEALATNHPDCFGAAAMSNGAQCAGVFDDAPLVPSTATASGDSDKRTTGCTAERDEVVADPCVYQGGDGSGSKVLLVGDSHGAHLTSLALGLADEYDWTVSVLNKGRCPFSDTERTIEEPLRSACAAWNQSALELVQREKFDLVITSQVSGVAFATSGTQTSNEAGVSGLLTRWQSILDTGAKIVAVKDNPRPREKVQICLEEYWPADAKKCDSDADRAFLFDPQIDAAKEFDPNQVYLLDFADLECREDACPAVIGGVNVYRDANHMTDTFVRTLVPFASERIPSSFVSP